MSVQTHRFTVGYFQPGTNELELFRNGVKLVNGIHYTEIGRQTVTIVETIATSDLIMGQVRGRQANAHPGLYDLYTIPANVAGGSSELINVPTFTQGNDSLRVYRNGKLLSLANGDYLEATADLIRVYGPLTAGDLIEFVVRGQNTDGEPVLFEELTATGGVNEVFTTASPYIVGSDTLEVYRNGKRLHVIYDFDELTTTTFRHNGTSVAGDTFTAIVRAEDDNYNPNPAACDC